jgi:hypothetical protein
LSEVSEATWAWQALARQTAAAWPSSGNKRSREDKQADYRRDAACDQTLEELGRKKARNELCATTKKQFKLSKEGARTDSGPSSDAKNPAIMVCYGCEEKGHALGECTKVEEDAKKSIMNDKFQEWKEARKEKKEKKKIGSITRRQ